MKSSSFGGKIAFRDLNVEESEQALEHMELKKKRHGDTTVGRGVFEGDHTMSAPDASII